MKIYLYIISTLLLFSTSFSPIKAQMKRFRIVPKYIEFNPKIELKLLGGISQPLGQYAKLTSSSTEQSGATTGFYGEVRIIQRSPLKPLWSLQLSLGYMQHSIAEQETIEEFDLATFQADDEWRHIYFMPAVAFRGGVRFRFEWHAAAGLFVYNGFNATSGVYGKNQVLDAVSWEYPYAIGGALRTGLHLGIKINKKWEFFAEANYWLGRGRREGIRRIEQFNIDPVQLFAIEPPIFALEQTIFDTVILNVANFGFGIKYKTYKHFYNPNIKYWNYY